ncbi:MAG: phosphohydrolase [Dehalogenimonas sp.]
MTEYSNNPCHAWIETYSGRRVYPLDMTPEDITAADIAHALAMKCRYGGHSKYFYSVAEHSVRVSHLVPSRLELPALLHDAAEAYLPDIVRPIKQHLPLLVEAEKRIMDCVARKFYPDLKLTEEDHALIKRADNIMLLTEGSQLMPKGIEGWETYGVEPLDEEIDCLNWVDAQIAFRMNLDFLLGEVASWLTVTVV